MKKYVFLFIALILGAFLRLWQVSSIPNGLTWDEAALGYNAYSILKTGRDEHGAFMPLIFESFGDYKPGAYVYFTVPSVAIFGLNEFAVRFPSVLAGLLAIIGVYLFTKELFDNIKSKYGPWDFAAIALAVSPWHVHFSRGGWEVNVFCTLLLFGLYYLLKFIKSKSSVYPTLLLACFTLVTYQGAKLLTPLVYLLFVVIFWQAFWKNFLPYLKSKKIFFLLPFIVFGVWLYWGTLFSSSGNRLSTLNIFNYKPPISAATKEIDNNNQVSLDLFHNQTQLSTSLVVERYLWHFSPEVLFSEGSIICERGHIPGLGVLNPLEIVWLAFGVIFLVKNGFGRRQLIILGLLLFSPIPASLTLAEFSTVRALFMTIPLAIISGMGIYYAIKNFKFFIIPIVILYALVAVYVYDLYFFHSLTVFGKEFNYGYKQAVQLIKDNPSQKVIFTDVLGQPYIYYVFYTAYDPATYQKNIDFVSGGLDVGSVPKVGNVEFHQFSASDINNSKDTLFVGSVGNIDNQFNFSTPNLDLYQQINTPDNLGVIFRVVKTKP
jgi:4-amino-4-deoxy-L-arabinose transferase-like glycosyltransferase